MLQHIKLPNLLGLTLKDIDPIHSDYHRLVLYDDKVLPVGIWQALLLIHPRKYLSMASINNLISWICSNRLITVFLSLDHDVLLQPDVMDTFIRSAITSNYYSEQFRSTIDDLCHIERVRSDIYRIAIMYMTNTTTDCILRITGCVEHDKLIHENHHYISLGVSVSRVNVENVINSNISIIKYLLEHNIEMVIGESREFYDYVFSSCMYIDTIVYATPYFLESCHTNKYFMNCLRLNLMHKLPTLSLVLSRLHYHIDKLTLGVYWLWLKRTTEEQKLICPLTKHNIIPNMHANEIIGNFDDPGDIERFHELCDIISTDNLIAIIYSMCKYDIVAICLVHIIKVRNLGALLQTFHRYNAGYINSLLKHNTKYTNEYKSLLTQL